MARNRDLSKLLSTSNGKIGGTNLDVSFENITDTGTAGTKVGLLELLRSVVLLLVNLDLILLLENLREEMQAIIFR